MRMRKLACGQRVVFYVPDEIETKIRDLEDESDYGCITISHILAWAIFETWNHNNRGLPLWATQGERYAFQQGQLSQQRGPIARHILESLLEKEARTIMERYQPKRAGQSSGKFKIPEINARMEEFNCKGNQSEYREEQERELAPEIEEEHYVETEQALIPAKHKITEGLKEFIETGASQCINGNAIAAFECFRRTTACNDLPVNKFPANVLVSHDFATTAENAESKLDLFLRSVRWVLTSRWGSRVIVVIISPFEANALFDKIRASTHVVLHMYAPRQTRAAVPLDDLELCPVPRSRSSHKLSWQAQTELNLFAGQLYFKVYEDYIHTCNYLNLAYGNQQECEADGFRGSGRHQSYYSVPIFIKSPVPFMKVVMDGIRKHGNGIIKTHMGKLLAGQKLTRPEIESVPPCSPDDDDDDDEPPEPPKKRKAEEQLLKQELRYDENGIKVEEGEEPANKLPKTSADSIFGKMLQRKNGGSR